MRQPFRENIQPWPIAGREGQPPACAAPTPRWHRSRRCRDSGCHRVRASRRSGARRCPRRASAGVCRCRCRDLRPQCRGACRVHPRWRSAWHRDCCHRAPAEPARRASGPASCASLPRPAASPREARKAAWPPEESDRAGRTHENAHRTRQAAASSPARLRRAPARSQSRPPSRRAPVAARRQRDQNHLGRQTGRALGQRQLMRIQCLRHHRVIADHGGQFDHAARAPAAQYGVVGVRAARGRSAAMRARTRRPRTPPASSNIRGFRRRDGIDRSPGSRPPLPRRAHAPTTRPGCPAPAGDDDGEFVQALAAARCRSAESRPAPTSADASSGLWIAARSGPITVPRGPDDDAVVDAALLGVMSSTAGRGMRGTAGPRRRSATRLISAEPGRSRASTSAVCWPSSGGAAVEGERRLGEA